MTTLNKRTLTPQQRIQTPPLLKKITGSDLKIIMMKVLLCIQMPGAFTQQSLALNEHGNVADVYADTTCTRDLLGWILKVSYDHWSNLSHGRKSIGRTVSMLIDSHIRTISTEQIRLMTVSELELSHIVRVLAMATNLLDSDRLPTLFTYAHDYESAVDRKKRLEKEAKRKAQKLGADDESS